jgi:glucokinase
MKETRLNVTGGDITGTHVALGGAPQYNVKTINLYNTFMNANKPYVIGVDLGGTNTVFGIVNANGEVIAENSIRTQEYPTAEAFVEAGCACLQPIIEQVGGIGRIKAMGIGAPNGNYYHGTIEHAPNLPWKGIIPLGEMFSKALGLPVALTNDANAAAIGEMMYGVAKGMKNFIVITLGTGVGSGIVINGQLVYGHDGFAGELGHVTMVRGENGRPCGCGRKGCLEAYCSATGVARTAREILQSTDEPSALRDIPVESITSRDVAIAADKGDKVAQDIFKFTGKMLGEACADFAAFSSPEAFIFFGGLTNAGSLIMDPIKEAYDNSVLPIFKGKAQFLVSGLMNANAAVLGASALGWEA